MKAIRFVGIVLYIDSHKKSTESPNIIPSVRHGYLMVKVLFT